MRNQILLCLPLLAACATSAGNDTSHGSRLTSHEYFDNAGRDDVLSGGVKLIPISTPKGTFKVWTKRVERQSDDQGPAPARWARPRRYFESADSWFPGSGVEYYYYDQLGSYYSDQPADTSLWDLPASSKKWTGSSGAQAHSTNFFLLGQSWAGYWPWSTRSNTSSISRGSSYRT